MDQQFSRFLRANSNIELTFSQDSSGALAAIGVNNYFTGSNATDIAVNQTLQDQPSLLAAAKNGQAGDNSQTNRSTPVATSVPSTGRLRRLCGPRSRVRARRRTTKRAQCTATVRSTIGVSRTVRTCRSTLKLIEDITTVLGIPDVGADAAKRTADALHDAIAVEVDVSSAASCDQMVRRALERFGAVNTVVTCAGVEKHGLGHEFSEEDFDRIIAVNLKGTWLSARSAVKAMIESGGFQGRCHAPDAELHRQRTAVRKLRPELD